MSVFSSDALDEHVHHAGSAGVIISWEVPRHGVVVYPSQLLGWEITPNIRLRRRGGDYIATRIQLNEYERKGKKCGDRCAQPCRETWLQFEAALGMQASHQLDQESTSGDDLGLYIFLSCAQRTSTFRFETPSNFDSKRLLLPNSLVYKSFYFAIAQHVICGSDHLRSPAG
jgi:hypothetical protein